MSPTDADRLEELLNAAIEAHDQHDLERADTLYTQVLSVDPDNSLALHLLGFLRLNQGRFEESLDLSLKSLLIAEANPLAYFNAGTALMALGRLEDAIASLERSTELNPDTAAVWLSLGRCHFTVGDLENANAALNRAVDLDGTSHEALMSLAECELAVGKNTNAIQLFTDARAIAPKDVSTVFNLGCAYIAADDPAAALDCFTEVLNKQSDHVDAHCNAGFALMDLCRHRDALRHLDEACRVSPKHQTAITARQLLYLYLDDVPISQVRQSRELYGAQLLEAAGAITPATRRDYADTQRRLRVGFVSGDFRDHPIGYLLRDVIPALQRRNLEIFLYATAPSETKLAREFRSVIPNTRPIWEMTDDQAAGLIRHDQIDVLIDLSGYTEHNRLGVFVRQPAPLQATWLGYAGSTGVPGIDYIIGDPVCLPTDDDPTLSEKPLRLREIALPYAVPPSSPDVVRPPSSEAGFITFGSFNNFTKLTTDVFETWSHILAATPGSRLLMKSGLRTASEALINHVHSGFTEHGIARERITVEFRSPRREMLARYHDIDIALDPWPFPGVTTTLDALWMGRPVISMQGHQFSTRMSDSILSTVACDAWLASDTHDYIDKAVSLATDPATLSSLSASLRGRMLASPISHADMFAADFDTAIRDTFFSDL